MIPPFPEFRKLELSDKKTVEEITSKFSGYSDFNFVSLWSYNTEDDIMISILNDNLVVKFRDYVTNERFYSFIGSSKVSETVDALLIQSEKEKITPILKLIPEDNLISTHGLEEKFKIKEDPDNHDYVLSIAENSSLEGSQFSKHRKVINKFYRDNPDFKILEFDLNNPKSEEELLDLFYLWENKRGKNRTDTAHELIAFNRTIKDFTRLNLIILGIYTKDQLIGIIVADTSHAKYIESHFLKTLPEYNGLNHILHHLLAKHVTGKGHEFINIEQDLGIEGLRFTKESSKPIKYLKKFTISRKSAN